MIIYSGYGIILVLVDYFGFLALLSKFGPYILKTQKSQYIGVLLFHIFITLINFYLSKYLNRKEEKHTVYGIKLEKMVLIVGIIIMPLLIMMGRGIIY